MTTSSYLQTLAAALLFAAAGGVTASACPVVVPVQKLDGVDIYTDRMGSVVDPNLAKENDKRREGLIALYSALHTELDATDRASRPPAEKCALGLLRRWSEAKALLAPPSTSASRVERVLSSVALNIFALKIRSSGQALPAEDIAWLRDLATAVTGDFSRDKLSGTDYFRNNVYIWAGVASGTFSLVERDEAFVKFSDQTWRDVMDSARPDGLLPAEIKRGARALIYQQFSFSALLLLRETRMALALKDNQEDGEKLVRLAAAIGAALCDDRDLSREAGAPRQEKPGGWGFRVADALGSDILTPEWSRCGVKATGLVDLRVGGDLERTREVIRSAAGVK